MAKKNRSEIRKLTLYINSFALSNLKNFLVYFIFFIGLDVLDKKSVFNIDFYPQTSKFLKNVNKYKTKDSKIP